jgi:teichuronic acid biosynthesis glycosyltransferase TuaC
MKLKHICIVAEDYPAEGRPSYPFVQQLAYSLSNEGVKCTVIAPQSITAALVRKKGILPVHSVDANPERENH